MADGLSCSAACGIFLHQDSKPVSAALAGGFLTTAPPGKPLPPQSYLSYLQFTLWYLGFCTHQLVKTVLLLTAKSSGLCRSSNPLNLFVIFDTLFPIPCPSRKISPSLTTAVLIFFSYCSDCSVFLEDILLNHQLLRANILLYPLFPSSLQHIPFSLEIS